mgnify:CR=1 FL=1
MRFKNDGHRCCVACFCRFQVLVVRFGRSVASVAVCLVVLVQICLSTVRPATVLLEDPRGGGEGMGERKGKSGGGREGGGGGEGEGVG